MPTTAFDRQEKNLNVANALTLFFGSAKSKRLKEMIDWQSAKVAQYVAGAQREGDPSPRWIAALREDALLHTLWKDCEEAFSNADYSLTDFEASCRLYTKSWAAALKTVAQGE